MRPLPRAWLVVAGLLVVLSTLYLVTGAIYNLTVAAPGYTNRIGNAVGTDFAAFYTAALMAGRGEARAVYDMDALHAAHVAVRGVAVTRYAWAYPPTVLLLLAPVALLPLLPALWAWLAATLAVLVAAARRIVRSPATPLLVLLFPGVATSLVTGPTGTLSAAIATWGLVLLDERRAFAGGVVLGLLTTKPHLAVLLPVCLLAARERAALTGFVVGAVGLVAASLLAYGIGPWIAFASALSRHMMYVETGDIPWLRMPTAFIAVHRATHVTALAWAAQAVATVGVVAACAWVWHRSRAPLTRALVLTAGIPLVGPYAYDYDTCALIAPVLWTVRGLAAFRVADGALLVALWLTPVALWFLSAAVGVQIGPLLLAGLVLEGVRRAGAEA